MQCLKCGNQIPADEKICRFCGEKCTGIFEEEKNNITVPETDVPNFDAEDIAEKNKSGKNTVVWIFVTVAALLLAMAITLIVLTVTDKKDPETENGGGNSVKYQRIDDDDDDDETSGSKGEENEKEKDEDEESPDDEKTDEFEESITEIKNLYYKCVDEMSSYETKNDGLITRYYDDDGMLAVIEIVMDAGGRIYYYNNDKLYFVYAHSNRGEDRYYFKDDKLIRWIDSEGKTHDEEYTDSVYSAEEENHLIYSGELFNETMFYRVRKFSGDTVIQKSAFQSLQNAMNEADSYASQGYAVYDYYGNLIYVP